MKSSKEVIFECVPNTQNQSHCWWKLSFGLLDLNFFARSKVLVEKDNNV
jgi:hypothetical protein